MKSVLISIQPKWCELIASGKMTVEVRKTKPKIDVPFKCYIYCTLQGSNEFFKEDCNGDVAKWNRSKMAFKKGKVIGEFACDCITPLYNVCTDEWKYLQGCLHNIEKELVKQACLTENELNHYASGKRCYAWHISDLKIYDKPKELGEFMNPCIDKDHYCPLCPFGSELFAGGTEANEYGHICLNKVKRPPQSWCYVESEGAEE